MRKTLALLLLIPSLALLTDFVFADPTPPADIAATVQAPTEEPVSNRFSLTVSQKSVPVYVARVAAMSAQQRLTLGQSVIAGTDLTSFASFELTQPVEVSVTCTEDVKSVKLLPSTSGITPTVSGKCITFTMTQPKKLTLEVNGNWVQALHLFANPAETDIPNPNDPNVIYYGPGIHEVKSVEVKSGQTVYLAPGAIVYGKPTVENSQAPIFLLKGDHITLRGRGIIDASLCPRGTRSIMGIYGTNIQIEGVIVRDSGGFNMPIRRSTHVKVSNVKIFGWRGNSDGIDICNSHDVEVSDCFLRTFDDLVVLKTDKGQGDEANITVDHCVFWNEFAHALSIGAELREPVTNVYFHDCDIIHDKGREWLLRIYNCDSASIKNVVFENIRIEEARRLMSVWIGKAFWSKETERGHIENVTFTDIHSVAPERSGPLADLTGFDADHLINQVQFQRVQVGGQPLKSTDIHQNEFVHNVTITP